MNTELLNAVKTIVAREGEAILSEPKRVSVYFTDLARDVPKPLKKAFVHSLEHNYAKILKDAAGEDLTRDRGEIKGKLAQRLQEAEGLDLQLCNEAMDLLGAVLFGEAGQIHAEKAKADAEARIKAEAEARIKAELEAKVKTEKESLIKAEADARAKAEAAERAKAEAEARAKAEREARIKAETAAKKQPAAQPKKKGNPIVRLLMNIGFEDADFPGYGINFFWSLIISLVITCFICFLVSLAFPQAVTLTAIFVFIVSFLAFYLTHVKLRVIVIIIAAIGLALWVKDLRSPSKSVTDSTGEITTQSNTVVTATATTAVNLRAEASGSANIIKTIKEGETVTITGEISGGWYPVSHNGDDGYIDARYLKTEIKADAPAGPEAVFLQAKSFYDKEQYDKAVPLLETLAGEGYAPAQALYGNCFYNGYIVAKDYAKAIEWWTKAADQGDARGQYGLGYCYSNGEGGLEQNDALAIEWLSKAANQDFANAQYSLGLLYLRNEKLNDAWEWLSKAAEQGHEGAKNQVNNNWHLMLDR